ncbi:hypothetical protein GCM10010300_46190 [Streptomyces olivaceoviridis]|nr:hypothetical protein GCM10010300_46190 [Streptomyces olivaceoviridis]
MDNSDAQNRPDCDCDCDCDCKQARPLVSSSATRASTVGPLRCEGISTERRPAEDRRSLAGTRRGMNGAFHLDSAWHHGWEAVASLVATTKATIR